MSVANPSAIEKSAMSKIMKHIIPLSILLYIINIIDRGNLGYAALDMNKALSISPEAFGSLTAMFFVGYFFFEIPSNMFMHRTGARLWMGRIMFTWGLVTCAMFWVQNFTHVAILRILLGVMEAGFFPGMMYYFTFFFPERYRAGIISMFFLAAPIAGSIGAPFATQIMENIHWLGHDGWRWVFMIEGLLAVVGAILTWVYLKNSPEDANWLTAEEKAWIKGELEGELANKKETEHFKLKDVFKYSTIWRLGFIYMFIQVSAQTFQFWTPTLVKEFSTTFSNSTVGWIMMMPGILGALFMLFWGPHSDRTNERIWHAGIPMLVFAVALGVIAFSDSITIKLIALALTGIGNFAFYGPYWAIPSLYLSGEALAIGLALINSLSSFAGFSGNLIIGHIKVSAWGSTGVLVFQLLCAAISFFLVITLKIKKSQNVTDLNPAKGIAE